MSAHHYLPQRHLNLLPNSLPQKSSKNFPPLLRPHIAERLGQLLDEIESFLSACTHEERCSFWSAIALLRQCLQKKPNQSEVPQFLTGRRTQRDFCRILEVLADLPYPKLHLSSHLSEPTNSHQINSYQIKSRFAYPHLATQR